MSTARSKTMLRRFVAILLVVCLVLGAFLVGWYTSTFEKSPESDDSRAIVTAPGKKPVEPSAPSDAARSETESAPTIIETRPIRYQGSPIEDGMKASEWEHHRRFKNYLRDESVRPLEPSDTIETPEWFGRDDGK